MAPQMDWGAVGGTVGGAVGGAVRGTVGGAVGGAVKDTLYVTGLTFVWLDV